MKPSPRKIRLPLSCSLSQLALSRVVVNNINIVANENLFCFFISSLLLVFSRRQPASWTWMVRQSLQKTTVKRQWRSRLLKGKKAVCSQRLFSNLPVRFSIVWIKTVCGFHLLSWCVMKLINLTFIARLFPKNHGNLKLNRCESKEHFGQLWNNSLV